jgi:hypothetical protein
MGGRRRPHRKVGGAFSNADPLAMRHWRAESDKKRRESVVPIPAKLADGLRCRNSKPEDQPSVVRNSQQNSQHGRPPGWCSGVVASRPSSPGFLGAKSRPELKLLRTSSIEGENMATGPFRDGRETHAHDRFHRAVSISVRRGGEDAHEHHAHHQERDHGRG